MRNVDHFNFKHERPNKNYMILGLCLSYLQFLLFLKKWMNINRKKMSTTSISIMRGLIEIEIWAISISSMRGWITILGFWLHVCPILTSCCSLNNGLTSIIMRNMGHFNFEHERLNKNYLILALCLSYLDF